VSQGSFDTNERIRKSYDDTFEVIIEFKGVFIPSRPSSVSYISILKFETLNVKLAKTNSFLRSFGGGEKCKKKDSGTTRLLVRCLTVPAQTIRLKRKFLKSQQLGGEKIGERETRGKEMKFSGRKYGTG